jgi:hypothetical protein
VFLSALIAVMLALLCAAGTALAQPEVSLEPAPDGTLLLVGNGWRSGQRLVVLVGHDLYPAIADSAGGFEVRTGQPLSNAANAEVSVRREDSSALGFVPLRVAPPPDAPHPFAVLFAQSLMMGTIFLTLSAGGVGALLLTARTIHSRRHIHR